MPARPAGEAHHSGSRLRARRASAPAQPKILVRRAIPGRGRGRGLRAMRISVLPDRDGGWGVGQRAAQGGCGSAWESPSNAGGVAREAAEVWWLQRSPFPAGKLPQALGRGQLEGEASTTRRRRSPSVRAAAGGGGDRRPIALPLPRQRGGPQAIRVSSALNRARRESCCASRLCVDRPLSAAALADRSNPPPSFSSPPCAPGLRRTCLRGRLLLANDCQPRSSSRGAAVARRAMRTALPFAAALQRSSRTVTATGVP
mmetsp:Transcript_41639/g.98727  ORF Transcript_41639/g.98727 Transcript_41639/m.98727 type:complete len:258 (+) Transcript_41639:701-1474(+)